MKSAKKTASWGGKRDGAGRAASSVFVPHASRPPIEGRECPVEITLKLRSFVPHLKSRSFVSLFRRASLRARRFGLRIVEYRIEKRRILLICEFSNRSQLESSFKSLNTTLAIAIKRRIESKLKRNHKGPVFLDRFQMKRLDTPLAMKLSLQILFSRESLTQGFSVFSSAANFRMWKKLDDSLAALASARLALAGSIDLKLINEIQASPRFWLSRIGWQNAVWT